MKVYLCTFRKMLNEIQENSAKPVIQTRLRFLLNCFLCLINKIFFSYYVAMSNSVCTQGDLRIDLIVELCVWL